MDKPVDKTQEGLTEQEREALAEENQRLLESNWDQVIPKFEDMGLKKDLLRGIFGYGFIKPSPIQSKGIPAIIKKKDVIAQAQSGSGKTATFSIGCLENIDCDDYKTQALILAPTRELAIQINEVVKGIGQYLKVRTHICTGGTQISDDKAKLKDGVNIIVGTPGRVRDLINRQILDTKALRMLILDEADEMLSKGFLEQINEIIKQIPADCQINLISATISEEIIKLTKDIMNEPAKILVKKEALTLEGLKQYYVSCGNEGMKASNLMEIFGGIEISQCIIYVNQKEKAEAVANSLIEKDFMVGCIHGSLPQEVRNEVMKQFRDGSTRILVSTDLLARGIDVHQVGLVINYELPSKKENYLHRIGRSGRYGRRGIAINLVSTNEATALLELQNFYHTQIKELPSDLSELDL